MASNSSTFLSSDRFFSSVNMFFKVSKRSIPRRLFFSSSSNNMRTVVMLSFIQAFGKSDRHMKTNLSSSVTSILLLISKSKSLYSCSDICNERMEHWIEGSKLFAKPLRSQIARRHPSDSTWWTTKRIEALRDSKRYVKLKCHANTECEEKLFGSYFSIFSRDSLSIK